MLDDIQAGQIRTTNEGSVYKILEVGDFRNIKIQFQDKHLHTTTVTSGNIRSGAIRNLYHPSIHGVGYMGVGAYKSKYEGRNTHIYDLWVGMLSRCYCKDSLLKRPTYAGCTVDEHFHCFQDFAHWCLTEARYDKEYQLDKDLLSGLVKVYSPSTCCFLPRELNVAIRGSRVKNSEFPVGVLYTKAGKYTAKLKRFGKTIHLGTFDTEAGAAEAYKKAKESFIRDLADKYKETLSENAYKALMNWTVY